MNTINYEDELKRRGIALDSSKHAAGERLSMLKTASFICSEGHTFTTRVGNVVRVGREMKRNQGCMTCATENEIKFSRMIAEQNLKPGHEIIETRLMTTTQKDKRKSRQYDINLNP